MELELIDFDARHASAKQIYQPLQQDEIRVLLLDPAEFGAPLSGRLIHIDLRSGEPTGEPYSPIALESTSDRSFDLGGAISTESDRAVGYTTISYAWGTPDFSKDIEIRGSAVLKISSSLALALQHIRLQTQVRQLWVDGICINQLDLEERSAQVNIMATIFAHADRGIIWLGETHDSDRLAYLTIYATLRAYSSLGIDPYITLPRGKMIPRILQQLSEELHSTVDCSIYGYQVEKRGDMVVRGLLAVWALFKRSCFHRLWVVQEISAFGLSTDRLSMQVGRDLARFDQFFNVMLFLDRLAVSSAGGILGLCLQQKRMLERDLETLMEGFVARARSFGITNTLVTLFHVHQQHCSDPRDRIYALRSVLRLEEHHTLRPNYELSVAEIYRRLAVVCNTPPFSPSWSPCTGLCLALVGTESERPQSYDLPSWVPNFNALSMESQRKVVLYRTLEGRGQFEQREQIFRPRTNFMAPTEIEIRGRIFARIETLLPLSQWPPIDGVNADSLSSMSQWYLRCRKFLRSDHDGHITEDSIADLLICGQQHFEPSTSFRDDFALIWEAFSAAWGDLPDAPNAIRHTPIGEFLQTAFGKTGQDRCLDRNRNLCLIKTNTGEDFAWVPRSAHEGDELCVFAGCPFPFVVRDSGNSTYQLLGDAYTARTTLIQALGGEDDNVRSYGCLEDEHPEFMDWNTQSREMRRLIRGMNWITLR